jgi:hypothetical protein
LISATSSAVNGSLPLRPFALDLRFLTQRNKSQCQRKQSQHILLAQRYALTDLYVSYRTWLCTCPVIN